MPSYESLSRFCVQTTHSRSKLDLGEKGDSAWRGAGNKPTKRKDDRSRRKENEEEVAEWKKKNRERRRELKKKLWAPVRPNVPTNRVTRRKYDSRRNSCHWRSARQRTRRQRHFDGGAPHVAECAAHAQSAFRSPTNGRDARGRSCAVPRVGADATSSNRAGALHPPRRVNAPAAWLSRMRRCRRTVAESRQTPKPRPGDSPARATC